MSTIKLTLFTAGQKVYYKGRPHTVSHVIISQQDIYVSLDGLGIRVREDEIECELTEISLERNIGG